MLPSNEEPGCSRIASSGSANARGKFREKGERKMGDDDEEAERKRQERERKSMSFVDRDLPSKAHHRQRLRGYPQERRTGRIVQLPLRLHPRVKAMVDHIMARDQPPSLVVLFEEMVAAYLEKHGPIDPADLPSDEELIRKIEQERDKRDAE
ncbi:MAG: hypothetical protein IPL91_15065 [Hyphomicrobium sp.]|nr:hypothetical protein [Hyphomicrobium sp.]